MIIGTAGHVDHGKSTLVEALTGIDPDRLEEEKRRQLTIDLGFAWLTLPSRMHAGVVDVPGHRDFIENMLAGVGGIDCVLFVVAADESVMPQTREHLAIVDLLGIQQAVVALTKIDLIDDSEWLELVQLDLEALFAGTTLQSAPIVPVSAHDGTGLEALRSALDDALQAAPPVADLGRARLPVDRVFTLSGFGTVVTGTLTGGRLSVGDEVVLLPKGLDARIRGMQSHHHTIERAEPGTRVAVNLAGVPVDAVQRGDVLTYAGHLQPTTLVDCGYRHLTDAPYPLKHNTQVKVFSGAMEVPAHTRIIGASEIAPGESGWIQLRLAEPAALARGDRYILRIPSPATTVGGGTILDPHPTHRWRRFKPEVRTRFDLLERGTPEERIMHVLSGHVVLSAEEISQLTGLPAGDVDQHLPSLAFAIDQHWWIGQGRWERFAQDLTSALQVYHAEHHLARGMPREALRSRLALPRDVFDRLAAEAHHAGLIIAEGPVVRLPEFEVAFSQREQQAVDTLFSRIAESPTAPPTRQEALDLVGEDVLHVLFERGDLVAVENGVFFDAETYQMMVETVRTVLAEGGELSVSQARDVFGSSRKYVMGLLEHLDRIGVTRREGDTRVLNQ